MPVPVRVDDFFVIVMLLVSLFSQVRTDSGQGVLCARPAPRLNLTNQAVPPDRRFVSVFERAYRARSVILMALSLFSPSVLVDSVHGCTWLSRRLQNYIVLRLRATTYCAKKSREQRGKCDVHHTLSAVARA
jgi:hypothetical protein